jgi:replicative DNA helicase
MTTAITKADRPLPHYLEAERSVLAALMLDNSYVVRVIETGLRSQDFFLIEHQRIFEAILSMDEQRKPIDLVTLQEEIQSAGKLEAVGGTAYLAQLLDGVPRVSNVEYYAQLVREKALLRNLIHAAEAIQLQAMEADGSVDEILDRAESSVFQLAEDRVKVGLIPVKDLIRDTFERIDKIAREGRSITGVASNYTNLDRLTSGFQPSELIVLAARPSQGKTALALNIAENVALRGGLPVAIFSLEMSKESLLQRMVTSVARVDGQNIRIGKIGKHDKDLLFQALTDIAGAPLWIDDSSSISVLEIGAKARRLKRDKGLSLLVVDYLQLITGRGRFNSRQEEVASISRGLKGLAKELQIPVLVLSQLSRAPEREERGPLLSDLRESGAIEQDADVVMFIYRPKFFQEGATPEERSETELRIAKQRNGPTDNIRFVFLSKFTRFEEAAPDAFSQFSGPDEQ